MPKFKKLEEKGGVFSFTSRKFFKPMKKAFKEESIKKAFNFAYAMTFGKEGEHRNHRSGGSHERTNGEIFINTFQGKLAEFAVYNNFYKYDILEPDLETYPLGTWDKYDFKVNDKTISVKSTKIFGNLLLLETKDWTKDGVYIPNNETYDFFILLRIGAYDGEIKKNGKTYSNYIDGEKLMKSKKLLECSEVDKDILESLIINKKWYYDIPGFITNDDLIDVIKAGNIIPKDAKLGVGTTMDAPNYYVQTGDMRNLEEIFKLV